MIMCMAMAYAECEKNRCIPMFMCVVDVSARIGVLCVTPQRGGRSGVCWASRV